MKKIGLLIFLIFGLALVPAPDLKGQNVQEDCVGFNPHKIEVKQIRGSWKIIEGRHWIMDFGDKADEARNAFKIIKKHGFDHICFIGRPDPSMTYFTAKERITTVFVVRHAERANDKLTGDGEKRAETLARMLSNSGVSVVFSTNTTRTKETVNNYADPRGYKITLYNTPEEVVNLIKSYHVGGSVLVAGHSNTVPMIIRALGVRSAPEIGNEFNNLFIVTIRHGGAAALAHLKYEIHHDLGKAVFRSVKHDKR
jgi:phosphohistidine phosphatase SixA